MLVTCILDAFSLRFLCWLHVFMLVTCILDAFLLRFRYVGYMYSRCIPAEISLCWLHVFSMHSR